MKALLVVVALILSSMPPVAANITAISAAPATISARGLR